MFLSLATRTVKIDNFYLQQHVRFVTRKFVFYLVERKNYRPAVEATNKQLSPRNENRGTFFYLSIVVTLFDITYILEGQEDNIFNRGYHFLTLLLFGWM